MKAIYLPAQEQIRSDLRDRQEVPIMRPLVSPIAMMEKEKGKQQRRPRRGDQQKGSKTMITGLWEREMFSGTKGSSTVLSAIEKSFKVNFKD